MHRRRRSAVSLATLLLSLASVLPPQLVLCVGDAHSEVELARDLCCGDGAADDLGSCPSDCVDTRMSAPILRAATADQDVATTWTVLAALPVAFDTSQHTIARLADVRMAVGPADDPPPRVQRTTIDRC